MNEHEGRLKTLFQEIQKEFKAIEKCSKDEDKSLMVNGSLTEKLNECKSQIKEWEREARMDGMAPDVVKRRKDEFVGELNTSLALKKGLVNDLSRKRELLLGARSGETNSTEHNLESKNTQELMQYGRSKIVATDESAQRSKQIVHETIQIGTETATQLHQQTEQMERIVQDLDDIHFNLKKAGKLLRDITRQLATDRVIMFFLAVIALGVVVIFILKAVYPKDDNVQMPGNETPSENQPSRRLLMI
mmetsp:Transcript_39864/g.55386  ORF Transcript_39864/g.55386 Transcript_39864/m.55386 type:complete len:247 (+) Transcript_39864:129-869(+)